MSPSPATCTNNDKSDSREINPALQEQENKFVPTVDAVNQPHPGMYLPQSSYEASEWNGNRKRIKITCQVEGFGVDDEVCYRGDNEGNGNDGNNREGRNVIVINNDAVDDDAMDDLQSMIASNNCTVVQQNNNDNNNNPPS